MENTDARTLSPRTQFELRKQIIRLREKGMANKLVAEVAGTTESHASAVWQTYQRYGMDAIKPKKRGRRHGAQRRLTPKQETTVRKYLSDNTPDQVELPFELWTRDAVRMLVYRLFSIDLPVRTTGDYLKRWDFTPRKPDKRACEQTPKKNCTEV